MAMPASGQTLHALPDQTSRIRLSNRDINHVVCEGGEIEDIKFSAEKGIAVEKGGSDAWIKFLAREIDDGGQITRSYVTQPSEFFVQCNGATYPLYAEPAEIPAQTVILVPGARQRAQANSALMAALADEDRAVSITMSLLDDRIPASFSEVAPSGGAIAIAAVPGLSISEQRRVAVEGAGLSASQYHVRTMAAVTLDERLLVDPVLGTSIFSITLDRVHLDAGETARLVVVRRGAGQ
ncbi:conjugal transfer pilus assembly protein TraK [Sphingobium xenophagum]|uniref:Conjugal transfer pilus assembly protein TraK n=2 Tax=Sphingobium xenophagum TaxID=121428 RepID=A0A401J714_SPHXE|nr:conjugal transfer pilus assembly protein TraK [Sphingobium xenophagum]